MIESMKNNDISRLSNSIQNVQPEASKELLAKELKKSEGSELNISLEAYQRLKDDWAEDKTKTSLKLEKDDYGDIIYRFYDKKTDELIKEVPSEDARNNSKRISDYLDKITKDLFN